MAPTKDNDTTHLDQFSAEELEDILVQLCDAEGVKVSADDDKPLKNLGKNALDNSGLGGLGKESSHTDAAVVAGVDLFFFLS